ncbi:hypothetical protein N9L68_01665 [bacterium]|nr:hypothetical protein [bacterium]
MKGLRPWVPHRGEWLLTALGDRYFREGPSEYMISRPVRDKRNRHRDNAQTQYRGYMHVAKLNSTQRATMAEITARNGNAPDLVARPRRELLNQVMHLQTADGNIAVHYSDGTRTCNHDTPRARVYAEFRATLNANASVKQEAF